MTLDDTYHVSAGTSVDVPINVETKHRCSDTTLTGGTIADMTTSVKKVPAVTQTFADFTDSESAAYGTASLCSPWSYTISPTVSYVTLTGRQITVDPTTQDLATTGTTFTVTGVLDNYPEVAAVSVTFDIVIDPCTITSYTLDNPLPASIEYVMFDTSLSSGALPTDYGTYTLDSDCAGFYPTSTEVYLAYVVGADKDYYYDDYIAFDSYTAE